MKIDKTFKIKEKYFNAILDNDFDNHKFFDLTSFVDIILPKHQHT